MRRAWRRWTAREDNVIKRAWGHLALSRLARRLGRSEMAVSKRAKRLGFGRWSQGRVTLRELSRRSGYHYRTLLKVALRLGPSYLQRRNPRKRGSPFALHEDVGEALVKEVVRIIGNRGRLVFRDAA